MLDKTPSICLGTAQFGMKYGVTNKNQRPHSEDLSKILKLANSSKISFIDTSSSYGNAEELLGNSFKNDKSLDFKIITKFSNSNRNWDYKVINDWNIRFDNSLRNLNAKYIDTYLIHDPKLLKRTDLFKLTDWLKDLKNKKLVRRIGISIYSKNDIHGIDLNDFDVVQLPLSIYDQRCITNGTIQYLSDIGKKIHIRSIFLQGLLLTPQEKWPNYISRDFKTHHEKYCKKLSINKLNLLDSALYFATKLKNIETFLIGVGNIYELKEIINSIEKINNLYSPPIDFREFVWKGYEELDPRNWKNR